MVSHTYLFLLNFFGHCYANPCDIQHLQHRSPKPLSGFVFIEIISRLPPSSIALMAILVHNIVSAVKIKY